MSSFLYIKLTLSAWVINYSKILFASAILLAQLVVLAVALKRPVFASPIDAWGWLGLSGLVGLVIGDTFFFRSLQILGPRRCLVVTTTAPLFTVVMGWLFLGETLTALALVGILLTTFGVAIVVSDRTAKGDSPGLFPGSTQAGILAGLMSSLCQAIGAVLSRHAMTSCDVEPAEATFIRLLAAGICATPIVLLRREFVSTFQRVFDRRVFKRFLPAIICGTWLGIWFSQVAFRHAPAGVAQTLLSTSPLFAIPLVWAIQKQRITPLITLGSVIAVAGILLVFWRQ